MRPLSVLRRRLKLATFAYNKADSKSQKGHRFARKMFGASVMLFERLSEYLTEKIVGHLDLETWFDRSLTKGIGDSFGVSPDGFPQIVTTKSLKNTGGGYSHYMRTIREVKMDAVNAALLELSTPEPEAVVKFTTYVPAAGVADPKLIAVPGVVPVSRVGSADIPTLPEATE